MFLSMICHPKKLFETRNINFCKTNKDELTLKTENLYEPKVIQKI